MIRKLNKNKQELNIGVLFSGETILLIQSQRVKLSS